MSSGSAGAISGEKLVVIEGMGHNFPRPLWPRLPSLIADHIQNAESVTSDDSRGKKGARLPKKKRVPKSLLIFAVHQFQIDLLYSVLWGTNSPGVSSLK